MRFLINAYETELDIQRKIKYRVISRIKIHGVKKLDLLRLTRYCGFTAFLTYPYQSKYFGQLRLSLLRFYCGYGIKKEGKQLLTSSVKKYKTENNIKFHTEKDGYMWENHTSRLSLCTKGLTHFSFVKITHKFTLKITTLTNLLNLCFLVWIQVWFYRHFLRYHHECLVYVSISLINFWNSLMWFLMWL